MSGLNLYIETGNEAFQDNEREEIARILRKLAKDILADTCNDTAYFLKDINGNTVGRADLELCDDEDDEAEEEDEDYGV